ncbi:hypothetical protein [Undibacterium baiyunense]|uniref:Uncharacterized protein n=1 Tax=Undibacterium baiyunense TaxID=2828731 RepID=A0A941DGS0_9BURK|nr:hypothetical protein [Undibacterium baiyunense]MBR7747676.1 hypothetical protein [Undibacterium baiyunense]
MRILAAVIIFAALGATGLSIAESKIKQTEVKKTSLANTVISIQCESTTGKNRCLKLLPPPPPPAPPAPPTVPATLEPPTPPSPPALPSAPLPPALEIPEELHYICKDKAEGAKIEAKQSDSITFSGKCVKRDGKMLLDIHRVQARQ